MSNNLTEVTTPARVSERRWRHDVPDEWQQGRGAFGGLVLSTLTRAIDGEFGGPERALRTLTAELCGPLQPGPADIVVEPLRIGSGTSTVAARMLQNGEVQAHAVAVLGRARSGDSDVVQLPRPEMPAWEAVPVVPRGFPFPAFARHFEYRPTGLPPFARAAEGRASGWVRPREAGPARDAAFLVAMADVWWPALFARLAEPRPMATITFTVDIVGDWAGLPADAPVFHDAHLLSSSSGYAPELRTLWGADGRLLTINHQTFVIIK